MSRNSTWDYLIITAANEQQASAYRALLDQRTDLGLIPDVKNIMVVPDPEGKRIGSGGSTILCLLTVLDREGTPFLEPIRTPSKRPSVFQNLRVLIIHAGGDSKRLPAYGPCGKIFLPIPGESDQAVPLALFDRLLPTYLELPQNPGGKGQIVVSTGDVLLFFDPQKVRFDREGITGLGCRASPETAKNHGVFCADPNGRVRIYLQKPDTAEQAEKGAIDHAGKSVLDIGVFSFDGPTAERLLGLCGPLKAPAGKWTWTAILAGKSSDSVWIFTARSRALWGQKHIGLIMKDRSGGPDRGWWNGISGRSTGRYPKHPSPYAFCPSVNSFISARPASSSPAAKSC
jgi:hypothetical protein